MTSHTVTVASWKEAALRRCIKLIDRFPVVNEKYYRFRPNSPLKSMLQEYCAGLSDDPKPNVLTQVYLFSRSKVKNGPIGHQNCVLFVGKGDLFKFFKKYDELVAKFPTRVLNRQKPYLTLSEVFELDWLGLVLDKDEKNFSIHCHPMEYTARFRHPRILAEEIKITHGRGYNIVHDIQFVPHTLVKENGTYRWKKANLEVLNEDTGWGPVA